MEKEQEENTIFDNRILKIIQHIKSNRNRAGYQNIQSFLNRTEPKLDMDKLKVRLGELEEQGIIINKVKGEVESFSIKQDSASGDTAKEKDGDDDIRDLKSFLDDSFYNVLINRIKLEVNNALREINVIKSDDELRVINIPNDTNEETKLKDEVISLKKVLECKDKTNESLLKSLYEEIAFLRNEITSKDTIIKMMLEERAIKGNKNNGQNLEKVKFNDDVNSNKEINADEKSRPNNNSTTSYTEVKSKQLKTKRQITILGTSIIKNIDAYEMKRCMKPNERIYIKSFPGAKVRDLVDYSVPSRRHSPDLFILEGGTNDLPTIKSPEEITNEIIELATDLKTTENDVIVSSIITRNDKHNAKGTKVNELLKIKCSELSLEFIDNSNIGIKHLHNSGMHLNHLGIKALANKFLNVIKV